MMTVQEWIEYFRNEKHYTVDQIVDALDNVAPSDEGVLLLYTNYSWAGKSRGSELYYELGNYHFSHN